MLKLTKKADYGLMAMRHLAEHGHGAACSAKDVAESYGIPQEALAKILQRLVKAGLLISQHGTNGGYTLASLYQWLKKRGRRCIRMAVAHGAAFRVAYH